MGQRLHSHLMHGCNVLLVHWQHNDDGADVRATIEVDHVVVHHADASARHLLADRLRHVCAVNAVHRAAEIHGARAERITRAAGYEARQIGLSPQHVRGRKPVWPLGLTLDCLHTRPGEALTTDTDAIADRLAAAEHEVKVSVWGIDDYGAGPFCGRIVNDLA